MLKAQLEVVIASEVQHMLNAQLEVFITSSVKHMLLSAQLEVAITR